MSNLRQAAQQALEDICGAKLCEFNSMSSRQEMVRLMDSAITALRAALAEPEQEPLPDKVLRGFFILTNTAEPLAEGWPGLERFARAIERHHGIGEQHE